MLCLHGLDPQTQKAPCLDKIIRKWQGDLCCVFCGKPVSHRETGFFREICGDTAT